MQKALSVCLLLGVVALGLGSPRTSQAQGMMIPLVGHPAWGDKLVQLERHKVRVTIKGRLAHTTISQVYHNPTARPFEASYVFALPAHAVIARFSMKINGKTTKGRVYTSGKAAQLYQNIVRKRKDPGLLEYAGRSLYRVRIFPIPAGGRQRYQITYVQLLPKSGGLTWYHYPLRALGQKLRTTKDLSLVVKMKTRRPLKMVYSPTHRISLHRKGKRGAVIGFEKKHAHLNRDFRLYYTVSAAPVGVWALHHKKQKQKGYTMMAIAPGSTQESRNITPKQVTFVLDTSGSMLEQKRMKWAQEAIDHCLQRLNRHDTFNVISFSTDLERLFRTPRAASPHAIRKARNFVRHLNASGGTALEPALRAALEQRVSGKRTHLVVLLTDGEPTVGETSTRGVLASLQRRNRAKARIFTFGVGTGINVKLLDQIATKHGGISEYVAPGPQIKDRIIHFFDKIRYPVLRDLKLRVTGNLRLYEIYPKNLPDIYRGGQLLLFSRTSGHRGNIVVTGWLGNKKKTFTYPIRAPKESLDHSFVRLLWAQRKMGYLLSGLRLRPRNKELRQAIIQLGKTYQMVTPLTSSFAAPPEAHPNPAPSPAPTKPKPKHRRKSALRGHSTRQQLSGSGLSFSRRAPNMRKRIRSLRAAYERSLKRNPQSSGRFMIHFTITATGRVGKVRIQSNTNNHAFAQRLRTVVRRWRFAKRSDGKSAQFSYPVVFSSASNNWRGYSAKTGKQAVANSKRLWAMKQANQLGTNTDDGVRIVKGRRFVWRKHAWQEASCIRATKHLNLRYHSKLYFALLTQQPALGAFLALGKRVTLCVGKHKALHIGSSENVKEFKFVRRFMRK